MWYGGGQGSGWRQFAVASSELSAASAGKKARSTCLPPAGHSVQNIHFKRAPAGDGGPKTNQRSTGERKLGHEVEVLPHAAEFLVAAIEKFPRRLARKREQLAFEDVAEESGGAFVVSVRAAVRFGDDFVDDAKFLEIGGHNLHGDGGGLGFRGIAPDNGGTPFRRNDGVETVLENID